MGLLGELGLSIGGKKLGDALGLGDVGSTILGGIGGFLGSLLPFKEGGKVPTGYRKVVHMGRVYLVAKKGKLVEAGRKRVAAEGKRRVNRKKKVVKKK